LHNFSIANQYLWIGITVEVFLAGIDIGYVGLQSTYQSQHMMNTQMLQHMMNLMNGTMMGSNMTGHMMYP